MRNTTIGFWFLNLCACVIFFGIWEYLTSSTEGLHFILPKPSRIGTVFWENASRLRFHALATLKEMGGGFVLALLVSFPLAWMMSSIALLRSLLQPFFVVVQSIPMFALAPLMVLWFGWSYTAIIVPTALMIFFPLTIAIYQGLCATPSNLIEMFRQHSSTPFQIFYKLQLPWAMPHLFTGFRIAVAMAGIGAVAGEWAGAQEGLGLLMLESRRSADVEMMFAALACVVWLNLILYNIVVIIEKIIGRRYFRARSIKQWGLLLMLGFACVGCQQETSKEKVSLVLDWLPNPNHVPIYAGIEKGFFGQQGIDLQIIKVADPSDTIPFLTSGQVNLCLTYMPHTIHAITHGAKVLPVGVLVDQPLNALIYRENEGINSLADLNGRIVGYCIDGYDTKFLKAMFRSGSIEPSAWRNVSFDLVSTLATKQVDFIYGAFWNIECENLRAGGLETTYFSLSDLGVPLYYELIFLVREGSKQANEDFIKAFQKGLQDSIDFSVLNPEAAFGLYLKANPDKSQKTLLWERAAWEKTISVLAHQQKIEPEVWNTFVEWLVKEKLIKVRGAFGVR